MWFLYPSMLFHEYQPTKNEAVVFKACGKHYIHPSGSQIMTV